MSFSPDWLALREPADHAALNPDVAAALGRHFAGRDQIRVVDLGCGAGSNLRGTFKALPGRQHWRLVDYDPVLLAAARERLDRWADAVQPDGDRLVLEVEARRLEVTFRQADLAAGALEPVLAGADLVTAAALFDLVSPAAIERLAAAVAGSRQAFHTVLTYDGLASWSPAHAADEAMRRAFNDHQGGDKGFGPAAGPVATDRLAAAFRAHGYRVLRGSSPWVLDGRFERLRGDLDAGWAAAVRETGAVDPALIDDWLAVRKPNGGVTVVGHEDMLAVPQN